MFRTILGGLMALSCLYCQTVVDITGAPIPNARVTINGGNPTLTGPGGDFRLPRILQTSTLVVAKELFTSVTLTLAAGTTTLAPIVLQLAPVSGTVSVTDTSSRLTEATSSATKTLTLLRDIPQSITVVNAQQMQDQLMTSMADVVRYVPGVAAHQGENNRDQLIIRGNSTSADFFVNGVRDDVQYYRDVYNLDRVEVLKGPNALIFGRGGAGGVVNRVIKEPAWTPLRELTIDGGAYGNKRVSTDLAQPLNDKLALRLNAVFEDTGSFRDYVNLKRYGVAPSLTWKASANTAVTLAFENFHDYRTADRGLSSFAGRPANFPISTFIGNPRDSDVHANVNTGSAQIEHQAGRLGIRNRTQFANFNRGYRNYVPGVISADQTLISISAYSNATARLNMFNQTDVTYTASTGRLRHQLLGGVEVGRQLTDNLRNTGYFNNTATSVVAPVSNPTLSTAAAFRPSATDANNHLTLNLGAIYVQDQVELTRSLQLTGGVRLDHFDLRYHDNRSGNNLRRIDNLLSPRAGIVWKPITPVSIYGSYSVSYLPGSGDQFSSLTAITQQVKPEQFRNYEIGVKWDWNRSLQLTSAVYRLDRTNTRSIDPNDATRIVQTGSFRTNGFEAGAGGSVTRAWKITGGYGYQDAYVTNATTTAFTGAQVAQVPHHTFSLWNSYQFIPRLGAGVGLVNRTEMFAAIDDAVRLPGYTRLEAALYVRLTEKVRLQANIENLADRKYYANADNNTNISPGSPRAARIGLTARF